MSFLSMKLTLEKWVLVLGVLLPLLLIGDVAEAAVRRTATPTPTPTPGAWAVNWTRGPTAIQLASTMGTAVRVFATGLSVKPIPAGGVSWDKWVGSVQSSDSSVFSGTCAVSFVAATRAVVLSLPLSGSLGSTTLTVTVYYGQPLFALTGTVAVTVVPGYASVPAVLTLSLTLASVNTTALQSALALRMGVGSENIEFMRISSGSVVVIFRVANMWTQASADAAMQSFLASPTLPSYTVVSCTAWATPTNTSGGASGGGGGSALSDQQVGVIIGVTISLTAVVCWPWPWRCLRCGGGRGHCRRSTLRWSRPLSSPAEAATPPCTSCREPKAPELVGARSSSSGSRSTPPPLLTPPRPPPQPGPRSGVSRPNPRPPYPAPYPPTLRRTPRDPSPPHSEDRTPMIPQRTPPSPSSLAGGALTRPRRLCRPLWRPPCLWRQWLRCGIPSCQDLPRPSMLQRRFKRGEYVAGASRFFLTLCLVLDSFALLAPNWSQEERSVLGERCVLSLPASLFRHCPVGEKRTESECVSVRWQ
eukprot:RCo020310